MLFHSPRATEGRAIPLKVLFHIAWRNLVNKKLRTFLTVFGVTIGIGAIFFLLSFALGLQRLVVNEIIGDESIKSIDISTPNSKVLQLSPAAIDKINNFPHVSATGREFSFPGILRYSGSEIDTVVYGIDNEYANLAALNVVHGKLLEDGSATTALVNHAALQQIGFTERPQEALGKVINLTVPLKGSGAKQETVQGSFTILGVIDSGNGSEIFLPRTVFESAGVPVYSKVKVSVDDTTNVEQVRTQIQAQGFQTSSPLDTIAQIDQFFRFFTIVLVGFGAIGMIVAVLGMFNTLTISLLERTKEIGLMMALGGRSQDMRKLFIIEAVLLSVIGAIVGITLAIFGGEVMNAVMNRLAADRGVTQRFDLFATPLWAIGSLILFMMLVGLSVVYFPARRAEKINPIDALRRE